MNKKEAKHILELYASLIELGLPDDKVRKFRQAYELAIKELDRPRDEWIPVTYRPMTVEERIEFAEYYGIEYCDTVDEKAFSSPLPEDGQEILVSSETFVTEDICEWDEYGCGLENNGDWDGITAWMPKPEPYKGKDKMGDRA